VRRSRSLPQPPTRQGSFTTQGDECWRRRYLAPTGVQRVIGSETLEQLPKLREQLARTSLLILDDWAVAPINDQGRQDLLGVIDDRVGKSAVVITSQVPVANWHAYLGEATIADAILNRVVHAAHRLELKGESMRRSAQR